MMSISDSWYRDLTLVSVSTLTTMTSTISDPDNDNDDEILQNIPAEQNRNNIITRDSIDIIHNMIMTGGV